MSTRLYAVVSSSTHGTWIHPNAREIVAQTFSDHDLPTPEENTLYHSTPDLDDVANEARYNDSLIASRLRRRAERRPRLRWRILGLIFLTLVVWYALVLFGTLLLGTAHAAEPFSKSVAWISKTERSIGNTPGVEVLDTTYVCAQDRNGPERCRFAVFIRDGEQVKRCRGRIINARLTTLGLPCKEVKSRSNL